MGQPRIIDEGATRWITLDRPEILNALRREDLAVIVEGVRTIGPEIAAIVLTGAGDRALSTGMHVDSFADLTPARARLLIGEVRDCLGALRLAPVATVAMLNGYCLGAAFEMALGCDLRIAHPDVRVGLPEVKLGIPSVVDAALLHHHVGLSKAKEIVLTGELYSVSDLATFGVVNRIVPASDLRAETQRMISSVTASTPEVVAAQKGLFETWLNHGLRDSIEKSVDVFAELFSSPATTAAVARYRTARMYRGD
jgi:enoyl-CoA hydratase